MSVKEARDEKQPSGIVKNLQCQADSLQEQLSEGMPLKSPEEIALRHLKCNTTLY
ncbi:hypothetical protein PsalN5692_03139 [Piscirickettsia salmonis]|uniref:hypothetical protein n=1 Tax=Piscirickettsia salmonis TaxID=1238 RepID=UPI0012BA0757|nr:hypothetical protein [Piscirickettsia salmonis]QGP51652.1 hypothetical protein PsalN5692_03139 [Piscirickettsia salmonis]